MRRDRGTKRKKEREKSSVGTWSPSKALVVSRFHCGDTPIIRQWDSEASFGNLSPSLARFVFRSYAFLWLAFIGRFDETRSLSIAGISPGSTYNPLHKWTKLHFQVSVKRLGNHVRLRTIFLAFTKASTINEPLASLSNQLYLFSASQFYYTSAWLMFNSQETIGLYL